jgi:hypothetical protein
VGGGLLGAGVAALSSVMSSFEAARTGLILGVSSVAAIGIGRSGLRRWLPERACQVSSVPLHMETLERVAIRWGLQLGFGLCTFVVTPALYALLATAVGQTNPLDAGALCMAYGISRGVTIASFAILHGRWASAGGDPDQPEAAGLERALRAPLLLAIAIAVVTAVL